MQQQLVRTREELAGCLLQFNNEKLEKYLSNEKASMIKQRVVNRWKGYVEEKRFLIVFYSFLVAALVIDILMNDVLVTSIHQIPRPET